MKRFEINGVEYKAKLLDFEAACELEEMGVSLAEVKGKTFSLIRAFFALCSGKSIKESAKEIERHVINGGKLDGISEALNESMEKSDFFRTLKETMEKENAESQEPETEEK